MKKVKIIGIVLFLALLSLPALADGVNKPKKKKLTKKTSLTKKVSSKKASRYKYPAGTKPGVYPVDITDIPPVLAKAEEIKPVIPFQIVCSEGKLVFVRVYADNIGLFAQSVEYKQIDFLENKLVAISDLQKIEQNIIKDFIFKLSLKSAITYEGNIAFSKDGLNFNFEIVKQILQTHFPSFFVKEIPARLACGQPSLAKNLPRQ